MTLRSYPDRRPGHVMIARYVELADRIIPALGFTRPGPVLTGAELACLAVTQVPLPTCRRPGAPSRSNALLSASTAISVRPSRRVVTGSSIARPSPPAGPPASGRTDSTTYWIAAGPLPTWLPKWFPRHSLRRETSTLTWVGDTGIEPVTSSV